MVSAEVLECWRHFVLACHYLLKCELTNIDIQIADALLLKFCTRFQILFGGDRVTPNMHLHCHVRQCVLDYRALRNFWLFAFEHYNGIIESLPTNNRNIEKQLMRKFLRECQISCIHLPEEHYSELYGFLPPVHVNDTQIIAAAKTTTDCLDATSKAILLKLLCHNEKARSDDIVLSTAVCKYPFIFIRHRKFGSNQDCSQKDTIVLAQWPIQFYGEPTSEEARLSKDVSGKFFLRPFIVSYYLELSYCVQGSTKSVVAARGCWPKYDSNYSYLWKPCTVWCSTLVESNSNVSFISRDQIVYNCAHVVTSISGMNSLCVCPVIY